MDDFSNLFGRGHSEADAFIASFEAPWEALPHIHDFVEKLIAELDKTQFECLGEGVYVHRSCLIHKAATIIGPTIIGEGSEVRPGAYIRGNVLIGRNCVIGNSTEIKNSILFDGAQVPHFNYIGDSILGHKAHFGAGALTSNVKGDHAEIAVKNGKTTVKTHLKKFGALVGDHAEIGCNAVLNPGTIIGPYTRIYPLVSVRGVIDGGMIVKSMSLIVPLKEEEGK